MGGAFVAVADDSSAVFLNPAGLGLLPKTELSANGLTRRRGATESGDTLVGRSGVGYVGGAGILSRRWALGAYVTEPLDRRLLLDAPAFAADRESGFLETTVTDAGVAASWHPLAKLYVGARVNVTHLRVQGEFARALPSGELDRQVGTGGGANRVTGDAGVILEVAPGVRLGVAFRQGATWRVSRTANDPSRRLVLGLEPYDLRSPSVLSGGLSFRAGHRLLVATELDFVALDQIRRRLAVVEPQFSPADYALDATVDARAGAEYSWLLGSASLQLRAGLVSRGASALSYTGRDAREARFFAPSRRRTEGTAGASLVGRVAAGSELALHVGASFGQERSMVSGGLAIRF